MMSKPYNFDENLMVYKELWEKRELKAGFRHQEYVYDFEAQAKSWGAPPFTGIGYFDVAKMLRENSDAEIKHSVSEACRCRYEGFDNENNNWRDGMGLDEPENAGKVVMDFGCGMGCEALQYAKCGSKVILADINEANVQFSSKALALYGFLNQVHGEVLVTGVHPFYEWPHDYKLDVFHASGVLHHTPRAKDILLRTAEVLNPDGGQVRMSLYSEHSWNQNKFPMSIEDDISKQPFEGWVRSKDGPGYYADWYSKEKVEYLVGDVYEIVHHRYASHGSYGVFRLELK
jgi:2-polyprenyl-3-methyl-5-hydroxy-6-metoxy-1,4-benzoquinol methylase